MNIKEYLNNPCKASSLPYWKSEIITIPDGMKIIREDCFHDGIGGMDEPYFKVIHYMKNIKTSTLPNGFMVCHPSAEEYVKHINQCYKHEGVSLQELREYQNHKVYNKDLWIAVKDITTNEIVASIIGELDTEIKEVIIEWVQVSKEYRRKGIGAFLVNTLLEKMKSIADFVTVSGRMNNTTRPLDLYLSCGFENCVIWHIVKTI